MTWPNEQFRIVKVFEPDHGHPAIVVVRSEDDVRKLEQALHDFVEAEGEGTLDASIVEFLEERGLELPLTYSAFWPYDKGLLE